jgi:hypothetical protein
MSRSPDPVFPGDSVTVSDNSVGTVDSRAIWVTTSADPMGAIAAATGS